jgi:hypothetical protein
VIVPLTATIGHKLTSVGSPLVDRDLDGIAGSLIFTTRAPKGRLGGRKKPELIPGAIPSNNATLIHHYYGLTELDDTEITAHGFLYSWNYTDCSSKDS